MPFIKYNKTEKSKQVQKRCVLKYPLVVPDQW